MNTQAKIKAQMATFDKLIQDIESRYRLGPEAGLLVQETLGLVTGRPGGIGAFLNRFKAADVSWLGGPDPVLARVPANTAYAQREVSPLAWERIAKQGGGQVLNRRVEAINPRRNPKPACAGRQ
ncbi:MAG TPA: hypothetical protein VGZ25_00835 [Gemmataceae bacterium]|jgi:hypothetical protein|nr:hypothetical protein [Gemmataceae bacterium]